MAVIVSDTFTRGPSTTAGTTEVGGKTWTGFGGATGGITAAGELYGEAGTYSGDFHFLGFDIGRSDNYFFEAKFVSATASFGSLNFRCINANTFIHVQVLNDGSFILESYVGGASVTHGQTSGGIYQNGDVIRAKVQGTTITVYRNGVELISPRTVTQNQAGTMVGVNFFDSHGATGNRFDNVVVDDLSTGGTTVSGGGTLTGTGTLTATGRPAIPGKASMQGTGTLTASGVPRISGSASLQGTATLTAAGTATSSAVQGTAALTGIGTLTSSGTLSIQGSATLQGTATLQASGTPRIVGSASLTGVGTLTASGTEGTPIVSHISLAAEVVLIAQLQAQSDLAVNLAAARGLSIALDASTNPYSVALEGEL